MASLSREGFGLGKERRTLTFLDETFQTVLTDGYYDDDKERFAYQVSGTFGELPDDVLDAIDILDQSEDDTDDDSIIEILQEYEACEQ